MFTKDTDFSYRLEEGFDHIFDEKGNTFLALRKIYWGDNETPKLDIRKWYTTPSGGERMSKGVSFITEDGPNELTRVLLNCGYGNTEQVLESIKDREDFNTSFAKVIKGTELELEDIDTGYYDPKEVLL